MEKQMTDEQEFIMTLDELALKIAKDILIFKWMFVPETRCLRIWTIVKENDKVIDVRDISEDELYGIRPRAKDYLEEYLKKPHYDNNAEMNH